MLTQVYYGMQQHEFCGKRQELAFNCNEMRLKPALRVDDLGLDAIHMVFKLSHLSLLLDQCLSTPIEDMEVNRGKLEIHKTSRNRWKKAH